MKYSNIFKINIFLKYLLLSILILLFIEILLFFFFNYEWSRKPRPFGEKNTYSIYYKQFHPLFRNLDHLKHKDLTVYDEFMDYALGPNSFLYRDYGEGYTSTIEVDEFKFSHNGDIKKNALLQRKKENNEVRIIFIGGSTTFGTGASNNSKTYPAQVERIINSLNIKDKLFLFINAGVLGFNTRNEYIYLKKYLIKLNPDLVVFLDGDNDAYTGIVQEKFDKEFHNMKITEKRNLKNNLFSFPQKLYLFNLLHRLKNTQILKLNLKNKENLKSYYHKEVSIEFKKNIENILEILESNGVKGIFYLQPNLFLKKKINKNEKFLLDSLKREGFKEMVNIYYDDFRNIFLNFEIKYKNNKNIYFRDISNLDLSYVSWAHSDDIGYHALATNTSNDIIKILDLD